MFNILAATMPTGMQFTTGHEEVEVEFCIRIRVGIEPFACVTFIRGIETDPLAGTV